MRLMLSKIWFMSILIPLLLVNCSDKPTHLEMIVKSGQHLNPNKNDAPSPVVLNFYELYDSEPFSKLDYWSLNDDPKKNLDGTLISQSKHLLIPNEEQIYKIVFNENTKYIGVVGGFRTIGKDSEWKFAKILQLKDYNRMELFIDNNSIKEIK